MTDPIRLRKLTEDDLGRVSEIHLAAFPQSALTRLGQEATRRYYQWQLAGPHPYVLALGCEYHGTLCGHCIAGRFHGALHGYLRRNWPFLAWRLASHPWLLMDSVIQGRSLLGLGILRARTKQPAAKPSFSPNLRVFGVLAIAVQPQFQGQGLGKALMQETERIAIQEGFQLMRLSVNRDNMQAIRFYEGQGWQRAPNNEEWTGLMVKVLPIPRSANIDGKQAA